MFIELKGGAVKMEADKIFEDEPVNFSGIGDEDFSFRDVSDSEEDIGDEMYAMVSIADREGKMFVRSWRAWLRFLAMELGSELYDNVPEEYMDKFRSDFSDILKFINIAIAGEDRFLLDEKIGSEPKL